MKSKLKQWAVWGIVGAVFYFILNHHIVFVGSDVRLLKKSHLTLECTLFSTQGKTNESILSVEDMRKDGIGKLLVEMGKISQDELDLLLEKYEE
jgi:hypothetical protein